MKRVPEELAEKLRGVGDRFLEQGNSGRLDTVAEEAGIPRATLYYYFSGRDDLVTFFLLEKVERVATLNRAAIGGGGTALDRFGKALRATVHELASNPALCLNLMIAVGRADTMADLMAATDRAIMSPLRELLIEARATGEAEVPDVELATSSLMGGISMAVLQRHYRTGDVDPDAIADALVSTAINGIETRTPPPAHITA